MHTARTRPHRVAHCESSTSTHEREPELDSRVGCSVEQLAAQVMRQEPYFWARRVFAVVDNRACHRWHRAGARRQAMGWPRSLHRWCSPGSEDERVEVEEPNVRRECGWSAPHPIAYSFL